MASGGFNFSHPSQGNYNAGKTNFGAKQPAGQFNFAAQAAPTQNIGTRVSRFDQTPSGSAQAPPASADTDSKYSHLTKDGMRKTRADESQRKRADDQLHKQKERRYDFLNHVRKITDLFVEEDEDEDNPAQVAWLKSQKELGDKYAIEAMEAIEERKKKKEERKSELWRFRNQLMHSEWLLEKPVDLEDKWVMIPVPQGKRNLVISTGGQTSTYSKAGMCISRFSSHLPGGGKHKHKWNLETSILDCVYNETTKTYYIMDMMCWRQTPMYDTETQFRFYWMHEKFLEVPEVAQASRNNPYRFEPLPNFRCSAENITNVLSCNMSVPLDGILFYHKEGHYTFGFTPLCLWLRPYMIPEALGIMVPQKFIERAPTDYKGFEKHREQCLKNMECRDENDKVRHQKKEEKRKLKQIEKLKAEGKDYSHIKLNFVSAGTLQSTDAAKEGTTSMET